VSGDLERKRILIVSGEPQILAEIKLELIVHFDVSMAPSFNAALSVLEKLEISAVVICISNNREGAFEIFSGIFGTVKRKNIPVIFLAERGNDDDETAAFDRGAVDYSVRRQGTVNALINRIKLRVRASETEKNCEIMQTESDSGTSKKTVLIADDVELNRNIVESMISDIEWIKLDFACNGKEVVEKFRNSPDSYCLILMDVQMPVLNGLDATRIIRGLGTKKAKEIPIIAVTAGVDDDEISLCLKSGMNDCIGKPMDYNNLHNVIAKYLGTNAVNLSIYGVSRGFAP